jgi:DegV family protein with EDD domain
MPAEEIAAFDLDVVSLWVNDGDSHVPDTDIDLHEFFARLSNTAALPTSSQPSVEAMVEAFTRAIERGSDVVGVFISEQMSGTIQAARLAAQMVAEQFPAARIELVDGRSNCMQEGYAVLAAARAAKAGESIERCVQAAIETTKRTRFLFSPASLEYLRRGGRIAAASALLGQLLQVRPILTVEEGEVTTFAKVRTTSRALAEMGRKFADDVKEFGLANVIVHNIGDPAPAIAFAHEFVEPVTGGPVRVVPTSAVIGVHVGPAVGLVYETQGDLRP